MGRVCTLMYMLINMWSYAHNVAGRLRERETQMQVIQSRVIDNLIKITWLPGIREERDIMNKLALLNTSILTTAGTYSLTDISLEEARELVTDNIGNLDSAIGHQSTAEIMTMLLGVEIAVNRQMFSQEVGQRALVFKLNGRPQEGRVLQAEEIEEIGYKFQVLTRRE